MPLSHFITIHGHFYQPPRENPWLEAVEVQDSAAPYHDWNERVAAECYAPNVAARRLSADDRIVDIVNNFEKISFDVGPTLLAWLARHRPDVYGAIIAADRASVRARNGHGNAIAQVYNHVIMPLATLRDKITQVRWGIEDFRARFGRDPEGMWLAETAVDGETLEVLADAGIRFAILAPHQAARVRSSAGESWAEVGERIDSTRAYRWRRDGRELGLFFYDRPISHAIAFEDLLDSGQRFGEQLRSAFSEARGWPQLVHVATDGESYGHHRKFGEMALASALADIESAEDVALTNYGAFLADHPPTVEVEIRERTSWSCAHGVERWQADCGCRLAGATHQRWRGPLREALDWLRGHVDAFYEARASEMLKDPWAARDAYIDVILDGDADRLDAFFARHQRGELDTAARIEARRLLEMQKNRLFMYTSCGWFFDDIAGLEAAQNLKYAAMAMQYLRDLGGGAVDEEFTTRLATAPSNAAEFRDGGEVYSRLVRASAADLRRTVAHYAMRGLLEEHPEQVTMHAHRIVRLDQVNEAREGTTLRVGFVRLVSDVTGETRHAEWALLHFGAEDLACGVRAHQDRASYDAMKAELLWRYAGRSLADVVRAMDDSFPGHALRLTDLFVDDRRRLLAAVLRAAIDKQEALYRQLWDEMRRLARYLRDADAPLPEAVAMVARHVLEQDVLNAVNQPSPPAVLADRLFDLTCEAAMLGVTLDLSAARHAVQAAVERAMSLVVDAPDEETVGQAVALINGVIRLGMPFEPWTTQNRLFELWRARPAARSILAPLAGVLGFALDPGESA